MRRVFRWVKAFKGGKFSVEDDTRPGRPKTSVTKANIAAVKIVVEQDARLSVRDIASCTGISEGSVQIILKKRLDLRKVCVRWYLLCSLRSKRHNTLNVERLKTYKGCSRVISNLLTGDETWEHIFEPQRRADNKQWKRKDQTRPCIAKRTISSKKMLYAIFFNSSGPVVQVPCPFGHTYSHWPILQEFCTEESESFTIRNDQAKDGQESTFYMTTPPLISVRLLNLFWPLKR